MMKDFRLLLLKGRGTAAASGASKQPKPARRHFLAFPPGRELGKSKRAFSLIELLVVIAVIGILAALSLVAVGGVRAGRDLTLAGTIVLDQFSLARQSALSKNARVRWQILSVPDSRNGDPEGFRRMRLEIFDPSARAWKPLGRPMMLPIAVVADPARSTLLTNTSSGATNAVVFLANGRTRLNPNNIYSLTLADRKNTNNFITIQLDPVAGRSRTFQP